MTRYEVIKEHLRQNQYRWLITGAAGFIGSNLVEALLSLNQKVTALDNFETGYQHNLDQATKDAIKQHPALERGRDGVGVKNFKFIEGDIRNLEECQNACEGIDYVLHQAALGSVPRSIADPILTNKANIDGFLNMLIAARDSKVKRFVYAASSSTYGDIPSLPKVEDKIGNPLSPYAVTKVVNELYARVFSQNYEIDTVGLRYFNIYGKRQDPNGAYSAVIPKWIKSLIKNEDVFINGDGETSRDFCYIENAVQMNLLAATTENHEAINQVYNVALNDRTSLNHLYQMIEERVIKRVKGVKRKGPIYRDFRAGDVRHSQADIGKAQALLDYTPSYSIADGLNEVIDWYISALK